MTETRKTHGTVEAHSGDRLETSGEAWTRELLEELRRMRYRPRGWIELIERSLERSTETRRARPRLAAQAARWSWGGALAVTVGVMRLRRGRGGLPLTAAGWPLAVAAMLRWHLGMVEGPDGEPREALGAADALTLARVFAAPLVVEARHDRPLFGALVAAGACSDALDGRLARRAGATRLGAQLDSVGDIVFFGAAIVAAAEAGFVRPVAARAVLSRHACTSTATAVHYFGLARRPPAEAAAVTRWAAPFLAGGLLLGASGQRRLATATVTAASVAATAYQIGAVARSAARRIG